jgi:DNA-binding response OmpR family regulator
MVTAKQTPQDKRQGFIVGTDDYMTKPVDDEEMVLRIKALLRRAQIVSEQKLEVGDVVLDYSAFTVCRGDAMLSLPQKEFLLLYKLLSYPNMIFTRLQLMDEIWGLTTETDDHTLNVHINRLREKFRNWDAFEIVTVRGLGYKAVKKI